MDLDAVRADLEQIVREADATIVVLQAAIEDPDEDVQEDEDLASEQTESDREEALVEAAELRRAEAQQALARLAAGSYGLCIDCGQPIAPARLEFRPEAARCLKDQETFEENEG